MLAALIDRITVHRQRGRPIGNLDSSTSAQTVDGVRQHASVSANQWATSTSAAVARTEAPSAAGSMLAPVQIDS